MFQLSAAYSDACVAVCLYNIQCACTYRRYQFKAPQIICSTIIITGCILVPLQENRGEVLPQTAPPPGPLTTNRSILVQGHGIVIFFVLYFCIMIVM